VVHINQWKTASKQRPLADAVLMYVCVCVLSLDTTSQIYSTTLSKSLKQHCCTKLLVMAVVAAAAVFIVVEVALVAVASTAVS